MKSNGADLFLHQCRKGFCGRANAEVDATCKSGCFEILFCDVSVVGLELKSDNLSIIGEGASNPESAIAAERTDFKNAFGACGADKNVEEFPLERCDINGRKAGVTVSDEGRVEVIGVGDQRIGEVLVDLIPNVFCFFGQGSASRD